MSMNKEYFYFTISVKNILKETSILTLAGSAIRLLYRKNI